MTTPMPWLGIEHPDPRLSPQPATDPTPKVNTDGTTNKFDCIDGCQRPALHIGACIT